MTNTPVITKARALVKNKKGSESVEFLGSLIVLVLIVMSLITVLAYVYRVYTYNYAMMRVVRSVEISGVYNETECRNLLSQMVPELDMGTVTLRAVNTTTGAGLANGSRIQLRETFYIAMDTTYTAHLFMDNQTINFSLPISVEKHGMSEVYYR